MQAISLGIFLSIIYLLLSGNRLKPDPPIPPELLPHGGRDLELLGELDGPSLHVEILLDQLTSKEQRYTKMDSEQVFRFQSTLSRF
jgi:hypothetical protein